MPSFSQRLGATRYEADQCYRDAITAYGRRDYDTASDLLREAIRLLPNRSEYHAALGLVLLEDGALDDAAEEFKDALRLYDVELLALYGLGLIAYRRKDYAAAIQHLQKATFVDPNRPETLYTLALAYYQQGDVVNAANHLARAHAIFEATGDKRASDSAKWIRELEKNSLKRASKPAPSMPLLPDDTP